MSDDIGFKIFAVIDGLKDSMAQASASVQGFSEKATKGVEDVNKGMKALKEVAEAYIAVLAVEKIEAFFDKFAEQATQVERLHIAFGATTDQVQELEFAMKAASGADGLQSMLTRLSTAMEKAIDNAGPQRKAFEDMGISLQFLKANADNVPAVLDAIADKVKETGGAQMNAADLTNLMGRAWANNAGLLNQGAAGIRELGQAAKETGGVMDELEINQFEGMHKSLTTMNEAFNGFGAMIASAFAPAFQSIVDGITELVSALNGGEEHVSIFRLALVAVVAPLDAIVLACAAVKTVVVEMWQIFTTVADAMYFSFKGLGLVIGDFLRGDFARMGPDWDNTMVEMDAETRKHVAAMKKEITDLGATAANMGKGIAGLVGGAAPSGEGDKPKPKTEQTTEEIAAAKAALAQKIQLEQMEVSTKEQLGKIALQTKKDELAAEVAAGRISKQEEIDALKDLANQEYLIDQKALQDEMNINGLTVVQKQKLNDQLLILEAKHNADIQKLNLQSVQAQESVWKGYATTVTSAFNGMLTGILQGTQTWQQAMGRMFSNLAITFIEKAIDKMIMGWVQGEATKTAATVTGDSLRTASNTAAAATGAAAQTAAAQGSIGKSAGQAAAAVYADVAAIPYIGWLLAPPAAAAAFVAVEAFGAGFSAESGFDIPAGVNPVTQLHQREMVLPAELADRVRGMTGGDGGGGDTHLHVHAVDADSVRRLFMNNGQHLAAALKMQVRNANPNVSNFKV